MGIADSEVVGAVELPSAIAGIADFEFVGVAELEFGEVGGADFEFDLDFAKVGVD